MLDEIHHIVLYARRIKTRIAVIVTVLSGLRSCGTFFVVVRKTIGHMNNSTN